MGTPYIQVSAMLLTAAADLAHLVSAQSGGSARGDVGFCGTSSGMVERVDTAKHWPILAPGYAYSANPHALRYAVMTAARSGFRTQTHCLCRIVHCDLGDSFLPLRERL